MLVSTGVCLTPSEQFSTQLRSLNSSCTVGGLLGSAPVSSKQGRRLITFSALLTGILCSHNVTREPSPPLSPITVPWYSLARSANTISEGFAGMEQNKDGQHCSPLFEQLILALDYAQDHCDLTIAESSLRIFLRNKLLGLAAIHMIRIRQRSRLLWVRPGEAKTRNFSTSRPIVANTVISSPSLFLPEVISLCRKTGKLSFFDTSRAPSVLQPRGLPLSIGTTWISRGMTTSLWMHLSPRRRCAQKLKLNLLAKPQVWTGSRQISSSIAGLFSKETSWLL